jgi:hypothetical protein
VCWPETTTALHGDGSKAHHESCIWQHVDARFLYCIVQFTCAAHCYGISPQLGCLGLTSQNTAAIRQVPPRLHGYTRCCPQTHDEPLEEFQHAAPRNVSSSSSNPSRYLPHSAAAGGVEAYMLHCGLNISSCHGGCYKIRHCLHHPPQLAVRLPRSLPAGPPYCYCYMVQDLLEHPVGSQRGSRGTSGIVRV